jgi:N-acetylneuraminate synthase
MNRIVNIGGRGVGDGQPVFVIAEAGVNHNGQLDLALQLIDAAAEAGADAVKFQTFKAHEVVVTYAEMAEYQKKNLGHSKSQQELLKDLETPDDWYQRLIDRCRQKNILFLSTPHGGLDSLNLLQSYNLSAYKIGSGDLNNLPFLRAVAQTGALVILSTGMATMDEVREAVTALESEGNEKIVLLHCTTNYPCPPEETNLRALQSLKTQFVYPIGYSDNSHYPLYPLLAVSLGACLIEKHFTLDRGLPGPDHKASFEPPELKKMVEDLRLIPLILGTGVKHPTASEIRMRQTVRKSLVTTAPLKQGELFTSKNLGIKRPGTGLPPREYDHVLGRRATRDLLQDYLISEHDVSE